MLSYAHPEVLVETQWVADHLNDPDVRIVEADVNPQAYDSGHIPGAIGWNLYRDLLQPDNAIIDPPVLNELLSRSAIANSTNVILYGHRNAPAAMAFWLLKIYGHEALHLMNGGRKKWIDEGRPITPAVPTLAATPYTVKAPDWGRRARLEDVRESIGKPGRVIVDVRNEKEYGGEMFWPAVPPQAGERAGHIPGAVHIPFELVLNEDGTFKPVEELSALYTSQGVTAGKEVITYCTVGGRSCNSWFVLKYLLGYPNVREYEASWYEWGRLPGVPIEK
jgi:thiosulfate/3-mercaptopyruvate sulfurtransferase